MTESNYYSAKELAGLPGIPSSARGVQLKAGRDNWDSRTRSGRGGGKEYADHSLPLETRAYLEARRDADNSVPAKIDVSAPTTADRPVSLPSPAALKHWQRECMDARMGFIRLIEQALESGYKMEEALEDLVSASAGRVMEVAHLARRANKRAGNERAISKSTLYRWWGIWHALKDPSALAPKDSEVSKLPSWAPAFLELYCVPQKPSVAACLEDMALKHPSACPSKDQVYRFLKKYSALDILKGRMTGAELSRHTAYIMRDTSDLLPLQVCVCDGHSFKAKVAHPKHGRPFSPEVCTVIDAATRFIPGWSAGLAESNQTVADAVRHALTVNESKPYGGMISILYSDKGSGNTADVNADPELGRFVRLGITLKTGRPGHPRARGIIERVNKSLWIPLAKKLPTYTGKDMDPGVARKVHLHLQSCVKKAKKAGMTPESPLLISWNDFLAALAAGVERYNDRPHSGLPKTRDPQTGKIRHMTPREAWKNAKATGWSPEIVSESELEDMFRPWVIATVNNGMVTLFGNIYFSKALEHYHRRKVIVEYEVQDGSNVLVRDIDHHRLICGAKYNANKKAFFPRSAIDEAEESRYKNRLATANQRIDEIEAEFKGIAAPVVIAHPPELAEARRQLALEMERGNNGEPPRIEHKIAENPPALPSPKKVVSFEEKSERQRYKHYKEMKQRLAWGETIPEDDYRRLVLYEQSAECQVWAEMEKNLGKVYSE